MAKQGAGFFGRHNNVYIYVPNLIGKNFNHCCCALALRCMRASASRFDHLWSLISMHQLLFAGYVRVAFALYAFAISMTSPLQCIVFYFFSFVCDELDGRFARMLGQTSTLGAVLDMVTDR